jgi:hypothetical protein
MPVEGSSLSADPSKICQERLIGSGRPDQTLHVGNSVEVAQAIPAQWITPSTLVGIIAKGDADEHWLAIADYP